MRAAAGELRDPWALAVALAAGSVAYAISVPWQFAVAAALAVVAVRVLAGLLIPAAVPAPPLTLPVTIAEGPEHLTPKELEVAALVYEGLRNKEIAARLFVEESTVKNHVQHIRDKLGFHTRGEIAHWWAEHYLGTRK
jgi:DNA-binding NarL/FixJ family response regulator